MDIKTIDIIPPPSRRLFVDPPATSSIALDDTARELLNANAVVAVSVSGGKDSDACALAVAEYLDAIRYTGPRLLVHSDLGRVEWKASQATCERLARHIGWELVTVRRAAGDMFSRWLKRWDNNVARYRDLSCVKLILPWSTPSMRFCTSELKDKVIASELKKRFPDREILNVTGIRRQESANRRRQPVSKPNKNLTRAKKGLRGVTWNAIIEMTTDQVFTKIRTSGLEPHEAYTRYNASRVSCVYCIMSTQADLAAATTCPDNHGIYVDMVRLELDSTFSFQEGKWLADVAPHLLPAELRGRVDRAKALAKLREQAEAQIPEHLLYEDDWPQTIPTFGEARILGDVRREVSAAVGVTINYVDPAAIIERYAQLMAQKKTAEARSKKVIPAEVVPDKRRQLQLVIA